MATNNKYSLFGIKEGIFTKDFGAAATLGSGAPCTMWIKNPNFISLGIAPDEWLEAVIPCDETVDYTGNDWGTNPTGGGGIGKGYWGVDAGNGNWGSDPNPYNPYIGANFENNDTSDIDKLNFYKKLKNIGVDNYPPNPEEIKAMDDAINVAKGILLNAKKTLADLLKKCNSKGKDQNLNNFIDCLVNEANNPPTFILGNLQKTFPSAEGHTFENNFIVMDTHYIKNETDQKRFGAFGMGFASLLSIDILHELVHNCGANETDVQMITNFLGAPRDKRGVDKEARSQMKDKMDGNDYSGNLLDWSPNGDVKCKDGTVVGNIPFVR